MQEKCMGVFSGSRKRLYQYTIVGLSHRKYEADRDH